MQNKIPETGIEISETMKIFPVAEGDVYRVMLGDKNKHSNILFSCHTNNGVPYANIISYSEHDSSVEGNDRCYAASRYKHKFLSTVSTAVHTLLSGGYCWDYEKQTESTPAMREYQEKQYNELQSVNDKRVAAGLRPVYNIDHDKLVNSVPFVNVHY